MNEIKIENIGKAQDKYLIAAPKDSPLWCCENKLKTILPQIYPDTEIIHNKNLTLDAFLFRPDFRLPELKIIVEFQGYRHYTNPKTIYRDIIKKKLSEKHGYKFIEVPYFIQLTENVTEFLFKVRKDFSEGFPHGFIHPRAMLLGEFSPIGLEKVKQLLAEYPKEVIEGCFNSLEKRALIDNISINYYNTLLKEK